jgi:hypothetical protein
MILGKFLYKLEIIFHILNQALVLSRFYWKNSSLFAQNLVKIIFLDREKKRKKNAMHTFVTGGMMS